MINSARHNTYNRLRSGCPVPTNLLCKCSQFLDMDTLTLNLSICVERGTNTVAATTKRAKPLQRTEVSK